MPTWITRFAVVIAAILVLTFTPMLSGGYAWAQTQRVERGAMYGGAAGLLFGDGLGGALTGATIGAGVGAATAPGYQGQQAVRGAERGALYGAGAGLLFGDGIGGALQGAVIGGAAGSIYGGLKGR